MDTIHQIRLLLFVRLCLRQSLKLSLRQYFAYVCHSHGVRTGDTEAEMLR